MLALPYEDRMSKRSMGTDASKQCNSSLAYDDMIRSMKFSEARHLRCASKNRFLLDC